jgi:hypothetical protein
MTLEFREAPSPEDLKLNVLLTGPPKTGKTLAAASAPAPILYLNADLPNATMLAHRFYGDAIMEVKYEGLKTLGEITNVLRAQEQQPKDKREVATVAIDPVGELHRRLMEEQSNRAIRPSRDTYGDVSKYIERFCREMCERDVNVVIVAHDRPVENDGRVESLPWTGTSNTALGGTIMGMVDVIGYTGIVEQEGGDKLYAAQLVPGGGRKAGDRFASLGRWQPLNLSKWVELSQQLPEKMPDPNEGEQTDETPAKPEKEQS